MKRTVFLSFVSFILSGCVCFSFPDGYQSAIKTWQNEYITYLTLPAFGYKAFASTGDPRYEDFFPSQVGINRDGKAVIPTGHVAGRFTLEGAVSDALALCQEEAYRLWGVEEPCYLIQLASSDD